MKINDSIMRFGMHCELECTEQIYSKLKWRYTKGESSGNLSHFSLILAITYLFDNYTRLFNFEESKEVVKERQTFSDLWPC